MKQLEKLQRRVILLDTVPYCRGREKGYVRNFRLTKTIVVRYLTSYMYMYVRSVNEYSTQRD